jgi:hypothetical protein
MNTQTAPTAETLAARTGTTPEEARAYWLGLTRIRPAELRVGDVVVTDGMRVLIDQPVRECPSCGGVTVWNTPGRVLNEDEAVEVHGIPRGWLRRDHYTEGKGWTPRAADAPRWTIQGSDLRWLAIEPRTA